MAIPEALERDLRTAARKVEEWRARRDELIRSARQEGGGIREIARAVEMNHSAVRKVLDRT